MKKRLLFSLLALGALISCEKSVETTPAEVEFTIDYKFAESGSMSKSASSTYDDFYENHIKTKELTSNTYSLEFLQGDVVVAKVNGHWDLPEIISLPEGKYTVSGSSIDAETYSELAMLSFDQEIEITSNTSNITLTALYNCFLVMLDNSAITSAEYNATNGTTGYQPLYAKDNILYIFIDAEELPSYGYIRYYRSSVTTASYIYLPELDLKNGFYYYFNDTTGAFEIPEMSAGV